MSCNPVSTSSCGCLYPSTSNCVKWKGNSISCGDTLIVKQGDTINELVANLIDTFCNGVTPSGQVYYDVNGGTGVTVTDATVGDTTTFTVGLSATVQNTITTLVSDVSTLQDCAETSIQEITTSTVGMTITDNGVSGCGRTWSVDYTPSGSTSLDGIVYNNVEKSGTSGSTGDKLLKSYNRQYISLNSVTNGDEIIFTATGQVKGDGSLADSVKIELWNDTSVLAVYSDSFSSFSNASDGYSSWIAKLNLTVSDVEAGDGVLSVEFLTNVKANGTKDSIAKNTTINVSEDISGIDYDNLTIKVIYVHDSTSGSTVNFARQLKSEVRKYIG